MNAVLNQADFKANSAPVAIKTPISVAWSARQAALAEILEVGSFYHASDNAPDAYERFSLAEDTIVKLPGRTVDDAIKQAWIALGHAGTCYNDRDRAFHELVLKADLSAMRRARRDMDFDQETIVAAILTLRDLRGNC